MPLDALSASFRRDGQASRFAGGVDDDALRSLPRAKRFARYGRCFRPFDFAEAILPPPQQATNTSLSLRAARCYAETPEVKEAPPGIIDAASRR